MNRKIFSFLVVSLFTVTAGCAVQSKPANQEIPKQNLPSEQVKAKVNQPIPVTLPTDATIFLNKGKKREGRVVEIDEKSQKLSIQRGREQESHSLSQIDKIVFSKSARVYDSDGMSVIRGDGTKVKVRPEIWRSIPMNSFRLLDPHQGKAEVNLKSVVSADKLESIRSVIVRDEKNKRQYVVDEMQFNVNKKTMTIVATPY